MKVSEMVNTSGNTKPDVIKETKSKRFRSYLITFWNTNYPRSLPERCKYLATCEDTTKDGKYHGHAFIYFENPRGLKKVKELFGNDCHCETPINNTAAINYVLNDKSRKHNFHEYGKRPMNSGCYSMTEILDECDSISDVMDKYPDTFIKYHKGIEEIYKNKIKEIRYSKPFVAWLYGSTGKGKTKYAVYLKCCNVVYNNGFYSDWGTNKNISIEELRGEIPYKELLKLLDGYHNYYQVNIKGGQKLIDLDNIIITSPYPPEEVYRRQVDKNDSIDQLLRRITVIVNVDEDDFEKFKEFYENY